MDLGLLERNKNFPTINHFYSMSIIPDLNDFYDSCMLMAIKSSNNQEIIDKLPFNKFVKLQKGLNKYLEAEAKQNGANNGSENDEFKNQMDSVKSNTSSMMSKAQNSVKMPKMKLK